MGHSKVFREAFALYGSKIRYLSLGY